LTPVFAFIFCFLMEEKSRVELLSSVSTYSAGIPKGPVAVLYLKFFPRIHELEKHTQLSMANLILIGTGIFLIFISMKRGKSKK